jgi:hypothetical protein
MICQFLEIDTCWFKFWIPSWHFRSPIKILTIEKIHFASIWLPTIPKIWLARYPTIRNYNSFIFHHLNRSSQDSTTNCKFHKHASSHCTYNQRQILGITHLTYICFCQNLWLHRLKTYMWLQKPKTYVFYDNLILSQSYTKHWQWLFLGAKIQ